MGAEMGAETGQGHRWSSVAKNAARLRVSRMGVSWGGSRRGLFLPCGVLLTLLAGSAAMGAGDDPRPDEHSSAQAEAKPPESGTPATYKPAYRYPVIEELKAEHRARQAERDSLRGLADERYDAEAKREREDRQSLRLDWSAVEKPSSPEAFAPAFHFPPQPQYNTGTCWAFCSVSFF